jgi:uncharacterized protein YecT (DUF1311 family)
MRSAFFCILICLLLLAQKGYAQSTGTASNPCKGIVVTSDLVQCLDRALKRAEAGLNRTYTQVQQVLNPKEGEELVSAQRLWIQYRDATCQADYDLYEGATGGPPARLACLDAVTRARKANLQRSYGWLLEKFGK